MSSYKCVCSLQKTWECMCGFNLSVEMTGTQHVGLAGPTSFCDQRTDREETSSLTDEIQSGPESSQNGRWEI